MKFLSKRPKINITTQDFYILMILISIMTIANAIFFGISMHYKNIIADVIKYNSTSSEVRLKLIINYIAFSSILALFVIHTYLAKSKIKIGYFYTNIWNLLITIVIAIPLIVNPNWNDPKIYINLGFYLFFLATIFRVYKHIWNHRRITGYWAENNGGSISW